MAKKFKKKSAAKPAPKSSKKPAGKPAGKATKQASAGSKKPAPGSGKPAARGAARSAAAPTKAAVKRSAGKAAPPKRAARPGTKPGAKKASRKPGAEAVTAMTDALEAAFSEAAALETLQEWREETTPGAGTTAPGAEEAPEDPGVESSGMEGAEQGAPEAITRLDAREFAVEAARLLVDDKCVEVVVLDVSKLTSVSNYIVIGTGTSDRQMRSVLDDVADLGRRSGHTAARKSVDERATWVLADFVDVVVHLFEPNTRAYYDLEMMWGDAPRVAWQRPAGDRPGNRNRRVVAE